MKKEFCRKLVDFYKSERTEYFKLKNMLHLTEEEIRKIPYKIKIHFDER